jgi:hypothetical protein
MPIKDKERKKEIDRRYRENNKEQIKESNRVYRQTEKGKKSNRIKLWRKKGVIGDYDKLYEKYVNTDKCEICKSVFKSDFYRCLDHDHETGEFRYVLCRACNNKDAWKNKIKD